MKKISKIIIASAILAALPIAACQKTDKKSSIISVNSSDSISESKPWESESVNPSSISSNSLSESSSVSSSTSREPKNYQGEGAPSSALGQDGDTYTDVTTNKTYKKENGVWILVSIPQALSGEGKPSNDLGNDGDTYTDILSGAEYVKVNGAWVLTKQGDEIYSVTFNLNGGHMPDGSAGIATQFVREGRWASEPPISPVKEHSKFLGWYPNGSDQKWNFVGTGVYGNVELIAQYQVDKDSRIIVTIDPNNGTDAPYTIETFIGDYLYPSAPSKPGYSFVGWYIESTGEKFDGRVTAALCDETLVAHFEVAKFNVTFRVEANDEITITGILNLYSVSVDIPSTISGRRVTKISKEAFNLRTNLQTVYIPASIKEIEPGAFRSTWRLVSINVDSANPYYTTVGGILFNKDKTVLECYPTKAGSSYTVPNTVKKIGDYAFYGHLDMGLSTINFNNGLEEIGDYAFYLNELISSIQFPLSLKKIGHGAFYGSTYTQDGDDYSAPEGTLQNIGWNEGLEEIGEMAFANQYIKDIFQLPSTVKKIGAYAFVNCTAITKFIINKDLEEIVPSAFNGCTGILNYGICADGNDHYKVDDGIIYSKDMKTLVSCPSGRTELVTVPNGVTRLEDFAFYMCDELQDYSFPSTLTYIGRECFAQTYHLNSFAIPNSVTEMGKDTFYQSGLKNLTIGTGLTEIPAGAFDTTGLSTVTIPANIKRINEAGFSYNSSLKTVTFAEGLEEIGEGAFAHDGLTSINLPNTLKKIEDRAFASNQIKVFNISKNLTEIGQDVFYSGSSSSTTIETITCDSQNTKYVASNDILYSKDAKTIYLAGSKVGSDGTLTIAGGVETIAPYAFASIKTYTELNFPSSLKEIGEGAFMYTKAAELKFGSGMRSIGEGAFYSAYTTKISFAEGITDIGPYAFNMSDLASVTLPNSLKNIETRAFSQTMMLKSYKLGTGLVSIGDFAFSDTAADGVTVEIPASCTSIGICAFNSSVSTYGPSLANFVVDNANPNYKTQNGFLLTKDGKTELAFACEYGYSQTASILNVPEGVETIAPYGLGSCRNTLLGSVTLPSTLKVISEYGFQGLQTLNTQFVVPASVEYIGERAFEAWTSKESIKFNISEENARAMFHPNFLVSCGAQITWGE